MTSPFSGSNASVAVVVVARGDAAMLDRTVKSCQRQTRRVDEIVIVGGAADASAALIKEWMGFDVRIRWISGGSAGAARLEGLAAVSCVWACFLDAGEEIAPDFVRERLGAAVKEGAAEGFVLRKEYLAQNAGGRT